MTAALPEALAALEGERIHIEDPAGLVVLLEPEVEGGFAYPKTALLKRGAELVLDRNVLTASIDRVGGSWLLDDAEQQRLRHGRVRWDFGPRPEGEQVFERGSVDALNQADIERARAYRNLTGTELARSLADIKRRLSETGNVSRTILESRSADSTGPWAA